MRRLFRLILSSLLLVLFSSPVFAQQSQISERNGDYPDPEHPGVRVRVFIHEAGKPLASTPICSDNNSSALVDPVGWKLPASNWTYNLNVSSTPSGVGTTNLPTVAGNGFSAWSSALASSSAKPTFVRGADTSANRQSLDGQDIIAWGRTSGTALAVTYTRYNSSTKVVLDVDTIFNQKFPWSWNGGDVNSCPANNAYDAQNILTHELGHWMGLDDEYASNYQDNTMYGYGSKNEVKKDTLTSGDINGVQAIY